jgi:hypothetical protein
MGQVPIAVLQLASEVANVLGNITALKMKSHIKNIVKGKDVTSIMEGLVYVETIKFWYTLLKITQRIISGRVTGKLSWSMVAFKFPHI